VRKRALERQNDQLISERNEMGGQLSTAKMALSLAINQVAVVQNELDQLRYYLAEYRKADRG
jgi:hypothetical protein